MLYWLNAVRDSAPLIRFSLPSAECLTDWVLLACMYLAVVDFP